MNELRSGFWSLTPIIFLALAGCGQPGGEANEAPAAADTESAAETSGPNCNFDSAPSGDSFDVVILNGRVMDPECAFDDLRNVGIADGRIALITTVEIASTETIDATGHVVTAGFIDTHHHGAGNPWGVKASLRDGVTTPMDLELGTINVDGWYAVREGQWAANYGAAASHEFHRMRVLDRMDIDDPADGNDFARLRNTSYKGDDTPDWAVTRASLEQLNELLASIDEDLRAGALGVASTTGYMANGITTL